MMSLFNANQDPLLWGGAGDLVNFGPMLPTAPAFGSRGAGGGHPCDIVERPDRFDIELDAPGFGPENIKVELQEDTIIISGEKATRSRKDFTEQGCQIHRSERAFNSFTRSFVLPENVKAGNAKANVKNGVLTVTLPKEQPGHSKAEPKRIAVTAAPESGAISGRTEPQQPMV